MTTKQWKVGEFFWLADGQYSSSRPADIDAEPRETKGEAEEDAKAWLGWLSERERGMADWWVRKHKVLSVADDGAIESSVSAD